MLTRIKTGSFLFIFLTTISLQAWADWVSDAKKALEDDKYERCIEIAQAHKDEQIGTMFLTFSYLQKYTFSRNKTDKEYFKSNMDILEDKVNADSLDNIYYFVQLSDKPKIVKEARDLVKRAFKNISDISEAPKLIKFLESDDEKTRDYAIDGVYRLIDPKRDYVNDGGTLREKDIVIMQDEKLIRALLKNVDESKARKTLELIEQPALPYLKEFEGKNIAKLEVSINKRIAKREKKYPKSNWYSATGKEREVAAGN